jgi:hypothetical protein
MWGDFYAKGGKDGYVYNTGFGTTYDAPIAQQRKSLRVGPGARHGDEDNDFGPGAGDLDPSRHRNSVRHHRAEEDQEKESRLAARP